MVRSFAPYTPHTPHTPLPNVLAFEVIPHKFLCSIKTLQHLSVILTCVKLRVGRLLDISPKT